MSAGVLSQSYRVLNFDSVESTNDEAKKLAKTGTSEGTVVVARQQTAGRGRRGRDWESKPGNLFMSVILRPECDAENAPEIGFVASLSICEALELLAPKEALVQCKWPNDVLIDGRKVSGLLPETMIDQSGGLEWLVLGIGVNCVSHPEPVRWPATNLSDVAHKVIEAQTVLDAILERLRFQMSKWAELGFKHTRTAWLKRAYGLGKSLTIQQDTTETGSPIHGVFADLSEDGSLLLDVPGGKRQVLRYGEVFSGGA